MQVLCHNFDLINRVIVYTTMLDTAVVYTAMVYTAIAYTDMVYTVAVYTAIAYTPMVYTCIRVHLGYAKNDNHTDRTTPVSPTVQGKVCEVITYKTPVSSTVHGEVCVKS